MLEVDPSATLDEAAVHVWCVRLTEALADERVLHQSEMERAARFRFPIHRIRFMAARTALRRLLGWRLRVPPQNVELLAGDHGKPFLRDTTCEFNLSHAEDLVAIAMTNGAPVGVDIEFVRSMSDLDSLCRMVFNAAERTQLKAHGNGSDERAFFVGWTRKEAFLKAIGFGLSDPLHGVTIDMREDSPRLLALKRSEDVTQWSLRNLLPGDGFVGAIAVRRPDCTMFVHRELPE
jgi:4'-phosphopantetheinyl transferase